MQFAVEKEMTYMAQETKRKKCSLWLIIILSVALFVAVLAGAWHLNTFSLGIRLTGGNEITLEYGQHYEESGANAKFRGTLLQRFPLSPEVTIEGTVDESKLGTYTVCYRSEFEGYTDSVIRTVHVVDTAAPVITLNNDPDAFTFPGQPYQEEGFAAADNYDGDITSQVRVTEKDGKVYYEVADSSGNIATAQRTIHYDDPVPPELVLHGDSTVVMLEGNTYKEPGYSANDNCDGDITANVTVAGTVDTQTPGTYTITYTVADNYHNEVFVTRTVVVQKKIELPPIPETPLPPNGKVIYLTFDDGPGPYTGELLDILKKYNVKATFFVVNTGYIGVIKRIAEEGHTVAMHSATHDFHGVYVSEEAYFDDLQTMQDIIFQYTGIRPTMLRFPGGTSNTISKYNPGIMTRLSQMVKERGYRYFDWNVDSDDAGRARSADTVYANVIRGIGSKTYSVVLQHDIKYYSVQAVERIIQWGLANGYTFAPLTTSSPACEHSPRN